MKKLFNNILVPLQSDMDITMALDDASRIAEQWQCRIHRLEDASERQIVEYCIRHDIDLILLERPQRPFWRIFRTGNEISVDRLLKKLRCPIWTTFDQPVLPPMKNIVLPVGGVLPMRKLLFATYLARAGGSKIHLVSMDDEGSNAAKAAGESLFRSYRLLRENTNLPVECLRLPGESLADIAWRYAREIKADLILIQPGKESLLSGFFGGWYRLFNVSRIPVLTVVS